MPSISVPGDIAHVVQIAITPAFMLVGIGALLQVMTNRLGRVIDRWRALEAEIATCDGDRKRLLKNELAALDQRMANSHRAITLATTGALLDCVVTMLLFAGQFLSFPAAPVISILFAATMAVLIASLISFLMEIRISSRTLRVTRHILQHEG